MAFMKPNKSYERKEVVIPGTKEETIQYACTHFVSFAQKKIEEKGIFSIALSGGSTPVQFYKEITKAPYKEKLDWSRVLLFWGDERGRPLDHKESNYHMAMVEGNLQTLPIDKNHIFPMRVDTSPKEHAKQYEEILKKGLGEELFDIVLLGVGEDGHTASLFPNTKVIDEKEKLVCSHFVTKKNMWRMTITFPCIARSQKAVFLVLGKNKAKVVQNSLRETSSFPAAKVGTKTRKSLWIVDKEASVLL